MCVQQSLKKFNPAKEISLSQASDQLNTTKSSDTESGEEKDHVSETNGRRMFFGFNVKKYILYNYLTEV